MYQRYGSYRLVMTFVVIIAGGLVLVAISKNRHKSVVGSVLINKAEKMFKAHPKIASFQKENNIPILAFNQRIIGGGMTGQSFDC